MPLSPDQLKGIRRIRLHQEIDAAIALVGVPFEDKIYVSFAFDKTHPNEGECAQLAKDYIEAGWSKAEFNYSQGWLALEP
jgi:hypothetical protein